MLWWTRGVVADNCDRIDCYVICYGGPEGLLPIIVIGSIVMLVIVKGEVGGEWLRQKIWDIYLSRCSRH